jgi:nicotinamidase-related amidase
MKKIIFFLITFTVSGSFIFAQDKKPERMHPALLVIDIQKKFLPMVDEREKEVAMYMINAYIDLFRKNGFPVIRIYHTSKEYNVIPGMPEFEFPDSVNILPEDPKVIKTYSNGFNKTDLEKILRDKGANTLFLCGLSSVGCVLATWMGAQDLDFKAFLLKDAMMSHNADYTNQIENIFSAIDYEVVEVLLDNAEKKE